MTETRRLLLALAAAVFSLAVLAAVASSSDHRIHRSAPTVTTDTVHALT